MAHCSWGLRMATSLSNAIDIPYPAQPSRRATFSEPLRASLELATTLTCLPLLARLSPRGDGRPVLTLPGYGGADGSMAGVRTFLKACGYLPYALELGRNLDQGADRIRSVDDAIRFRDKMVAAVSERVRELYAQTGEKITLVGWSLGGVYAVDVSQQLSEQVRQVITLGSPFGDPRGTSLFKLMRTISGSTVPLESQDFAGWCSRARLLTDAVPISVLFSRRDGIVSPDIAKLTNDGHVRYRELDSSHVGFAFNPRAYRMLARELALQ